VCASRLSFSALRAILQYGVPRRTACVHNRTVTASAPSSQPALRSPRALATRILQSGAAAEQDSSKMVSCFGMVRRCRFELGYSITCASLSKQCRKDSRRRALVVEVVEIAKVDSTCMNGPKRKQERPQRRGCSGRKNGRQIAEAPLARNSV